MGRGFENNVFIRICRMIEDITIIQVGTYIKFVNYFKNTSKIPHDLLCQALKPTVDSIFNDTNRKFLAFSERNAYFVKNFSSKFKFDNNHVNACSEFLIDNAYFRVGNAICKQRIGIPMGSDPAPFFANLFLSHYEAKWIKTQAALIMPVLNVFLMFLGS